MIKKFEDFINESNDSLDLFVKQIKRKSEESGTEITQDFIWDYFDTIEDNGKSIKDNEDIKPKDIQYIEKKLL